MYSFLPACIAWLCHFVTLTRRAQSSHLAVCLSLPLVGGFAVLSVVQAVFIQQTIKLQPQPNAISVHTEAASGMFKTTVTPVTAGAATIASAQRFPQGGSHGGTRRMGCRPCWGSTLSADQTSSLLALCEHTFGRYLLLKGRVAFSLCTFQEPFSRLCHMHTHSGNYSNGVASKLCLTRALHHWFC